MSSKVNGVLEEAQEPGMETFTLGAGRSYRHTTASTTW